MLNVFLFIYVFIATEKHHIQTQRGVHVFPVLPGFVFVNPHYCSVSRRHEEESNRANYLLREYVRDYDNLIY